MLIFGGTTEGRSLCKALAALVEAADYVTEMVKHRHPYDVGAKARIGVEN